MRSVGRKGVTGVFRFLIVPIYSAFGVDNVTEVHVAVNRGRVGVRIFRAVIPITLFVIFSQVRLLRINVYFNVNLSPISAVILPEAI